MSVPVIPVANTNRNEFTYIPCKLMGWKRNNRDNGNKYCLEDSFNNIYKQ